MHQDDKLWYACDPCRLGQDSAPRPPPLQHRVPIRADNDSLSRNSVCVSLARLLWDLFSHRLGVSFWWMRASTCCRYVRFQPHSSWTIRMSLSTLVNSADIAQRRFFGMFVTPDMFGPNQSPLSAFRLPQAPASVVTAPSPMRPFASLGEVQLSSALAGSRRVSLLLTDSLTVMRAYCFAFESLTPSQLGGKLWYACDPCPIMARSVPPSRLRSCTGFPY